VTVIGQTDDGGAAGHLGRYRARDGSPGAPVELDLETPHAVVVVGKRGSGKSHTLGVIAEELLGTAGVTPVVADPMGVFGGLSAAGAMVRPPGVPADALPPSAWPNLLGLPPDSAAGSLVWRAATEADSLAAMAEWVAAVDADGAAQRAARNHLDRAASWGIFGPDTVAFDGGTVVDLTGVQRAPRNAAVRAVAAATYDNAGTGPLPWLLVDEAHALTGVAWPALRRLLTRGRTPGASVVLATQRPGALPEVAISQADILMAHRLTARSDLEALGAARQTYLRTPLSEQLPGERGEAIVVDDATESVHAVRVRERQTPDGGATPRAGDRTEQSPDKRG